MLHSSKKGDTSGETSLREMAYGTSNESVREMLKSLDGAAGGRNNHGAGTGTDVGKRGPGADKGLAVSGRTYA